MTMPIYYGNTENKIDWKTTLDVVRPKKGVYDIYNPSLEYSDDKSKVESAKEKLEWDLQRAIDNGTDLKIIESARKVLGAWWDNGYTMSQVMWEDFYAGDHFDISVQETFAKIVEATPIRVMITRLQPGKVAPPHYDVFPDLSPWKDKGRLVRYTCFIDEPEMGHTFSFPKHAYFNEEIGNIYEWEHVHGWHAGANASLRPYYLFHFIGYK